MSLPWHDQSAIDFMLDECEIWAIVGLSGDPSRTAYSIAQMLQTRGKRIVPVHPSAPTVLGEKGFATLADIAFSVDVVDVFRRSDAAGQVVDSAIAANARGVWLQLGVVDLDAFSRAREIELPMVMDTCPAIEWRRRETVIPGVSPQRP